MQILASIPSLILSAIIISWYLSIVNMFRSFFCAILKIMPVYRRSAGATASRPCGLRLWLWPIKLLWPFCYHKVTGVSLCSYILMTSNSKERCILWKFLRLRILQSYTAMEKTRSGLLQCFLLGRQGRVACNNRSISLASQRFFTFLVGLTV